MAFRLYAIRIFSFEWKESLAFYRDVIGLRETFADERGGWAQLDLGGVSLGLERCDPEDAEAKELVGRFVGASIMVDDIDAVHRDLTAKGVEFVGALERQPWGGVLAHFKDPDGNVMTLLGSSDAEQR